MGIKAYLDDQFNTAPTNVGKGSNYPDLTFPLDDQATACPTTNPSDPNYNQSVCNRDFYSMYPVQRTFFANSLYGPDQLRQRVAFALHQVLVISGASEVNRPSWMTVYLQALDRGAFGNYRNLLEEVALTPAMGEYLDMRLSTRTSPNENWAREVLQLFSIGTSVLNADGSPQLDSQGLPQHGFMVRGLPTPATLILEALLLNRLWPGNPVNRRYRGIELDDFARVPVEQPAGAFLMIRREAWKELGGFDEGFHPLWFEDVDFCRRLADRGYLLFYEPKAVAKHTGAHSIRNISMEMRRVCWYRSLLRYSARHFSRTAFRSVSLAVLTGSFLRGFAESAFYRSLKPLAVYGKVARLAGRYFLSGGADGVVLLGPKQ
jgi:hypothetical protein